MLGGRSDDVVRRVLAAAVAELACSGYAGFRMDEVATTAGVNRTTVYRRWPSRAALVADVVERLRAPFRANPLPDTGSLEHDLVEAFAMRARAARKPEGRAWARLLGERHDPEVRTLIRAAIDERSAEWRRMVTRAIARRELPAATDPQRVLDFVRALVESDAGWLAAAVRTVIAGARAGALR